MDALRESFGAGCLDSLRPVDQQRGEDLDHLAVAAGNALQLLPDPAHGRGQVPVTERGVRLGSRTNGDHRAHCARRRAFRTVPTWFSTCPFAAEKPAEVRDWLRATLNDATMGNAGTRLRTPADLRTWGAIAVLLRAPGRWQVERVDPMKPAEAEVRSWSTARPAGTQAKISQSNTAKSIVARVRLLRPEVVATGKGQPKGSWAGCVRLAAHLAAIWLNCAPGGDEEG